MTDHVATNQGPFAGTRPSYGGPGEIVVVKLHVDMGDVKAALGAVVASGDNIQIWNIPIGTLILGSLLKVTTVEGEACTCALGDNAGVGTYIVAGTNLNSATTIVGTAVGDTYGLAHKIYASADTLDVLFGGGSVDIATAVFDVYVYCIINQDVGY